MHEIQIKGKKIDAFYHLNSAYNEKDFYQNLKYRLYQWKIKQYSVLYHLDVLTYGATTTIYLVYVHESLNELKEEQEQQKDESDIKKQI